MQRTARKSSRKARDERLGQRLVQATVRQEAYDQLVSLAERDTRSLSNYIERVLYQHLGMLETPPPE